jgi:hypothetical protein
MKIISSEIRKGTRHPILRRTQGLNGGIITFIRKEATFTKDIFFIIVNDKKRFYKVAEVSTIDKIQVEVAAVEYGYYANYLSNEAEFDVRSLIDMEVTQLTDLEQIQHLINSNSFT